MKRPDYVESIELSAPDTLEVRGRTYPIEAIIEALTPHVLPERLARMETILAHRLSSVVLGLEDLYQTHNGAACLRTAEALGLQDVVAIERENTFPLFSGERHPPHRKITRSAHHWVDVHRTRDLQVMLAFARAHGMAVMGAGPRATRTLDTLPEDRPLLLLFGNESEGIKPETMALCDDLFRIPMWGFTESFNVSVSVGMTLSAVVGRTRSRLAANGETGDLPWARQRYLLAKWFVESVRAADAIVRHKLG